MNRFMYEMGKSESHARLDLQITFKFVLFWQKIWTTEHFLGENSRKIPLKWEPKFWRSKSRTEQFSEKKSVQSSRPVVCGIKLLDCCGSAMTSADSIPVGEGT